MLLYKFEFGSAQQDRWCPAFLLPCFATLPGTIVAAFLDSQRPSFARTIQNVNSSATVLWAAIAPAIAEGIENISPQKLRVISIRTTQKFKSYRGCLLIRICNLEREECLR
jgi:hypothetical protein